MSNPNCPTCRAPLFRVRQSEHSMLNSEQFDAVKAGDWYCDRCTSGSASTGYKYWWNSELKKDGQDV